MAVAASKRWLIQVELPGGELWEHHCWATSEQEALGRAAMEFPQAEPLKALADAMVQEYQDE